MITVQLRFVLHVFVLAISKAQAQPQAQGVCHYAYEYHNTDIDDTRHNPTDGPFLSRLRGTLSIVILASVILLHTLDIGVEEKNKVYNYCINKRQCV